MIVEIIDEEERLKAFAEAIRPTLEETPKGFLVTIQDIEILFKKQGRK